MGKTINWNLPFLKGLWQKDSMPKYSVYSARRMITHKEEITSRILFMMYLFCQGTELMTQVLESAGLVYWGTEKSHLLSVVFLLNSAGKTFRQRAFTLKGWKIKLRILLNGTINDD